MAVLPGSTYSRTMLAPSHPGVTLARFNAAPQSSSPPGCGRELTRAGHTQIDNGRQLSYVGVGSITDNYWGDYWQWSSFLVTFVATFSR